MIFLLNLISAFGAVFTFTFFVFGIIEKEKLKMKNRVTEVVGEVEPIPIRQQELSFPLYQRFIKPMFSGFLILTKYIPVTNEEVHKKLKSGKTV